MTAQTDLSPNATVLSGPVSRRRFILALVAAPMSAALVGALGSAPSRAADLTPSATPVAAASVVRSVSFGASMAQETTGNLVAATNSFLESLTDEQRAAVSFPYPFGQTMATEAQFPGNVMRVGEQFGASVWSNYPISDVIRPGLRMGDLTDGQRTLALTILAATLSQAGYQKVVDIMNTDQVLADSGTQYSAGTPNYVIGLLGAPSESERWMWQFGGHHLALNATVQGPSIVMAPVLTGCQPSTYTMEGLTIHPLGRETDKGFQLLNTLDASQQQQAVLPYSVTDLVLGPGHDGQTLPLDGIPAASLDSDQQGLLLDLASEWVYLATEATAAAKMAEIQASLPQTYFAWSGPTTPGSSVYFRMTGPAVQIEFSHQGAMGGPGGGGPGGLDANGPSGQVSVQAGGVNHIHTVYRDGDYGRGLS